MKLKSYISLLIMTLCLSCEYPYDIDTGVLGDQNILVIESFIRSDDISSIRLKEVFSLHGYSSSGIPEDSYDAWIEDEYGNIFNIYQTRGINTDVKYRLHVQMEDGRKYESDFITLTQTPEIEKVDVFRDASDNRYFYINLDNRGFDSKFFKWNIKESCTIFIPPVDENDHGSYYTNGPFLTTTLGDLRYTETDQVEYYTLTSHLMGSGMLVGVHYIIEIEQCSLESEAYLFWKLMEKNSNDIGGLFGSMPSEIPTNIRCTTHPNERVIGFVTGGNKRIIERTFNPTDLRNCPELIP